MIQVLIHSVYELSFVIGMMMFSFVIMVKILLPEFL